MPFCVKCGQENGEDVRFCPKCGTQAVGANDDTEEHEEGLDVGENDDLPETNDTSDVNPFDEPDPAPEPEQKQPSRPPLPERPPAAAAPVFKSTKQKLIEFYEQYKPEKLRDMDAIDQILADYGGREDDLFRDLATKYNVGRAAQLRAKEEEKRLVDEVINGLKVMYRKSVRPVEEQFKFGHFHSPSLNDTDFEAKPMVLLLGQYSVGKTTFIQYLLEREFPGQRIGPEPTTDRFVVVMHGHDERTILGNALAVDQSKPFTALNMFGMSFLNKIECAQLPSPTLENLTLIDTPGVLSGEKQRIGRSYDFPKVVEWFAGRVDRILLLFDAHKLDISDEFKSVIEATKGNEDKIRVVLNKADKVSSQELMRVYGALMWSLGKIMLTPEVLRVYIGSFWDRPLENKEHEALFEAEARDLLADLRSLPRNSTVRKVNEIVKRTRMVRVHARLLSHLRNQFGFFGKAKTQDKLLTALAPEYRKVQTQHNLPKGDFPAVKRFKETLSQFEIHKFPKADERAMNRLEQVLNKDIPHLMKRLPGYRPEVADQFTHASNVNPFDDANNAIRAAPARSWQIDNVKKAHYDNMFNELPSQNGFISGGVAAAKLGESGLPKETLKKIWDLADIDRDGKMDSAEFSVAMFLVDSAVSGQAPPAKLPPTLVPPNKRKR